MPPQEDSNTPVEVTLGRHDERIRDLEEWRDTNNAVLDAIRTELQQLRQDWGQRPTWIVTVLVGILSSACVGMAVFIITHINTI